jgi:hypothetical protein
MKTLLPWMVLGAMQAAAQDGGYVNFLRKHQQASGVIWDMPAAAAGSTPAIDKGNSLFQLWSVEQGTAKDHLLDQKLLGAYIPVAEITITTLDPGGRVPRTRVDQPFTVDINISGLLTGVNFPIASSNVLLERHLASDGTSAEPITPASAVSGTPAASGYIRDNGRTVLKFPASSLTATDPTTASGEEHFVIHTLSDGSITQTQIASARVQVWPVASGEIKGITQGARLTSGAPDIKVILNDLYPRSDTYLMLYKGSQIHGNTGSIIMAYPMDRDVSESTVIGTGSLDSMIGEDGTYTLALLSDTVFGRELLCETVTFHVNRGIQAGAVRPDSPDRGIH